MYLRLPISSVNKMAFGGKECLARIWFVSILLLIFIWPAALSSDPCQTPSPIVSVTENVANGSMLLKINYTKNQNWTILKQSPNGYFELKKGNTSYYIITTKVLDYDVLKAKADKMFVKLQCKSEKSSPLTYNIFIILSPVNEYAPHFTQPVFNKTIPENTKIGDLVFNASTKASDDDYPDSLTFEAVKYSQSKNTLDGITLGKFKMVNYQTGEIKVDGPLDYEEQNKYIIQMIVEDSGGNKSSAKLIINISDVDDLGPTFEPNPCGIERHSCQVPVIYQARIKAADKGQITILPNPVKAVDMEANHYNITYSFIQEDPSNIQKYFKINAKSALVSKEEELPKNVTSSVKLFIKAEEESNLKHSSVAILIIDILDRNSTIIISKDPPDSISNSKMEGFSSDVFYGVLVPLVIIVGALSLCIVLIVVKSKKNHLQNSNEDLKSESGESIGSSVAIKKTDSLLSPNSTKGTSRSNVEMLENGLCGVSNQAFVPDASAVEEDGGNRKRHKRGSMSTEDNDMRSRSLHSDENLDEFGYCNLTTAGMYVSIEDLRKVGVDDEEIETARDGDIINNNCSTNSKEETLTSDGYESNAILTDGEELNKIPKDFSGDISDTWSDRVPEISVPDYILEDKQNQCGPNETSWALPSTKGQLESEVSEFILRPEYIENVSERSASLETLSARVSPQTESHLESTGTTDYNQLESNSTTERDNRSDSDEDNRVPEWASKTFQPTIRPMGSREEFKSHLESLISAPPQLPPSKGLAPPSPSLTSSTSSQSPVATPKAKTSIPSPTPSAPPLPSQLPLSSAANSPSPPPPPPPPPLPPIQIMATHL